MRTVQKEGANRGRDFYCCSNPREEQCGYFQWRDEIQGQGQAAVQGALGARRDEDEVNCDCGQPAVRRKVTKDGANKGREFYCCSKPRDDQCRYFQWLDELAVAAGGAVRGLGGLGGLGGRD